MSLPRARAAQTEMQVIKNLRRLKAIHFSVILFMLLGSMTTAQAAPSVPASDLVETDSGQPFDGGDGTAWGAPNSGGYDPTDPAYYISLRWMVYMMILSLPLAPAETAPVSIPIPPPQIPRPHKVPTVTQ